VQAAVTGFEAQLRRIESQVAGVQAGIGRVSGDIEALRTAVAQLATQSSDTSADSEYSRELLDLVGRHFETLGRDVRQIESTLRAGLGDSVRAAVKDAQAASQQAITASETGLRAALDGAQTALRSLVQESQATVRSTVAETQAQLGTLVARAQTETRAQLERGLAKVIEEIGQVRDTRGNVQTALDSIVRETREVATLARRVESTQALTNELLDEQRQVAAKLDEREKHERALQFNNAGVLSYHQGSYDASVDQFKRATELDPSLAEAFNNLGLSYTEMGRDEEATLAFQRALELDPSAAHVYNNLGYLYYKKGDLNHAVEMYQRAIQRGADTSSAYSNLANAFYRLRRLDEAVAAWRRALEIDPANQKAATALERLGIEARPK